MKRALKWSGLALLSLLLLAGAVLAHTWYLKPLSINWFYNRAFLQFALEDPELLTHFRILEPFGFQSHNGRLTDASIAHEDLMLARLKDDYATLHRYDASSYTGQDRLSYEILDYYMGMQVRGEPWRHHNYPINQLFGVQSELPNMMTQVQQVNNATDAEHYIARLGAFPHKLEQVIETVRLRESKGIIPPRFAVDKVLDQIKLFLDPGAKGNTLTVSFKEKLDKIPADRMDEGTRSALLARAEQAVAASVIPAYNTLAAYFESLRSKATRNDGVWALPQGDEFYKYAVESNTTTTMSPDRIHALGLTEVARIGAEMDRILDAAGYTQGTLAERMRKLAKSPAQLYPDTDEGRAQILADYQAIIDEMTAGLDPYFGIKPKAKVVVKRVPTFTEKSAPGAYYYPPPLDGSRPASSSPTCAMSARYPSTACAPWHTTRPFPATICRSRSRRRSRGCRSFAACCPSRPTAKAGRCTRNSSRGRRASKRTRSTIWAACKRRCSVRCGWWSTPAYTPSAGRASRRSTT